MYRRYQAEGVEGLRTRSKAPKTCPNATHVEVVGKIIYLRQNYHFGPEKIAMYLKRYHDVTISNSGVWRILNRLDMGRLPASQRYKRHDRRWKRYEKQLPGHRVQIDVKFIEPLAAVPQGRRGGRNKYFQFTAIDNCTRPQKFCFKNFWRAAGAEQRHYPATELRRIGRAGSRHDGLLPCGDQCPQADGCPPNRGDFTIRGQGPNQAPRLGF
ncbi:helix-turn-helix domain-containing protein [Streptomyces mirabilis]|uniref:helix-turn-helix domain-containing protein n=1 Tax=Streptomyces mirabilis TaxID=68239 RepID=UPI00368A872C